MNALLVCCQDENEYQQSLNTVLAVAGQRPTVPSAVVTHFLCLPEDFCPFYSSPIAPTGPESSILRCLCETGKALLRVAEREAVQYRSIGLFEALLQCHDVPDAIRGFCFASRADVADPFLS